MTIRYPHHPGSQRRFLLRQHGARSFLVSGVPFHLGVHRYGTLEELAWGSDLLVAHNAIPEGASGAARSLHMPPSGIGRIANAAGVGMLVLSHRMQRTLGRERETESAIRNHFPGPIAFADDLDRYTAGSTRQ